MKVSLRWTIWVKTAGLFAVCEVAEKKCYLEQQIGDS